MVQAEEEVLRSYADRLREEGFEVFVDPPVQSIPAFLGAHRPDAIAIGPNKNLAIEVRSKRGEWKRRFRELHQPFSGQTEWELVVLWLENSDEPASVELTPAADILKRTEEVASLIQLDHYRPALLLTWGIIEAIGRQLQPTRFAKPQSPGRLVEYLAAEGQLTPDEADTLRRSIRMRNSLMHGGLGVEVSRNDALGALAAAQSLLRLLTAEIDEGQRAN